jgi:trans-aconitate methyltransferase
MKHRDAVDMLAPADLRALGPTTWADLGCGDGTFTLALCALLAPGSTVHAVDVDRSALDRIPSPRRRVTLSKHAFDFTSPTWPLSNLDGILMANSLHYVPDQRSFIARASERLVPPRRFLVVEYDTEMANQWVPFPVSSGSLGGVFGGFSVRFLDARRSTFRAARLYSALVWDNRLVGA